MILFVLKVICACLGIAVGCILIGVGVGYNMIDYDVIGLISDAGIPHPVAAAIILGVIICLISVFSLISAILHILIIRIIFWIVLTLLLTAFLIIAILVFTNRQEFVDEGGEIYDRLWKTRKLLKSEKSINSINSYLECCGKTSYLDYEGKVPPSCCAEPVDDVCSPDSIYTKGCHETFKDFIASKADWIGCGAIVACIILGFILLGSIIC